MKRPYLLSVATVAAGILVATIFFRSAQTAEPPKGYLAFCEPLTAANKPCLSEIEKKLVETQDSLSKWLLGLAYTTLGGMLALRVKNWRSIQVVSRLPMVACALLVVSLFGAYLFQVGIIFALSNGPLYHLDTGVIWVPLLTQFWSLVGALSLLAVWLYGPRRAIQTGLLLVVGAGTCRSVSAQELTRCAQSWQRDRGFTQDSDLAKRQAELVQLLAKRATVTVPSDCAFTDATLDQVRFAARQVKRSGSQAALKQYTDSLVEELETSGVSMEEVTNALVGRMKFWLAPSGLVILRAAKTDSATIDSVSCLTPCTVRVFPGKHAVQATDAGKVVYSCSLEVASDGVLRIDVDKEKCK